MIQAIKKMLKLMVWLLVIIILYVAGVLLYGTLNDFQPEGAAELQSDNKSDIEIIQDSTLTFTTWNLGYGGLGAESNFFYDSEGMMFSNGKMIRPTEALVEKYIRGIGDYTKNNPSDFMLFQEVDYRSKRSYYNNQYEMVSKVLPGYSSSFAVNYLVDWVPLPIFEPWHAYGATNSGLGSWSKFQPKSSKRVQLPGAFPWPTKIFQLDRCVNVQRFEVEGEKELVVINVHNSAYDKGGTLKKAQMEFLQQYFRDEYEKGNYVVVGGDWNQCPPGLQFDKFMPGNTSGYTQTNIKEDFLPAGWTWAFDPDIPTNRKVRDVYKEGETFVTIIDFFLVSPNVKILETRATDLNFLYSDHQPVSVQIQLSNGEIISSRF